MKIELDFSKTIEQNATDYFEKSKMSRKKIDGIKIAICELKKRNELKKRQKVSEKVFNKKRSKKWFEKYRWFISSDSFLIIGGRDAQSNEEIVKKRMKPEDVYFHADVFGAPHCIIQSNGKGVPSSTMLEGAQFAVTFSKAWQEGRAHADAYSVKPEQVSKKAPSGESLGTGAFMIYGERIWFKKTSLSCAIGYNDKEKLLMGGPFLAVKNNCRVFLKIKQGIKKKSDVGKEIFSFFQKKGVIVTIDEIISLLPNGESDIEVV
jgi:predicted ribosome quality control (RQC) complex YloA/Tae2 family protein